MGVRETWWGEQAGHGSCPTRQRDGRGGWRGEQEGAGDEAGKDPGAPLCIYQRSFTRDLSAVAHGVGSRHPSGVYVGHWFSESNLQGVSLGWTDAFETQ